MPHMDTTQLEDFLALCETLNFSAAATQRHLTQPAFSRRIRALEDTLGAPLFVRNSRSVTLTAAGAAFKIRAASLLREWAQARDEVQHLSGTLPAAPSVAATQALSFTFLPQWLLHVYGGHLSALHLLSGSYTECETLLQRGKAAFMLCYAHPQIALPLPRRTFTHIRLAQDEMHLLSANTHGNARYSLHHPNLRYLGYAPPSGLANIISAHCQTHAIHLPAATLLSPLAATLKEMVKAGEGAAWIPASLAARELADGELQSICPHPVALDIVLVRPTASLPAHEEHFWQRATQHIHAQKA